MLDEYISKEKKIATVVGKDYEYLKDETNQYPKGFAEYNALFEEWFKRNPDIVLKVNFGKLILNLDRQPIGVTVMDCNNDIKYLSFENLLKYRHLLKDENVPANRCDLDIYFEQIKQYVNL